MIYVMSGGGGSNKAVGAISVTYPVGSTCTCTNGSKTLKAKDTSGKALFLVEEFGTWTISSSNGSQSGTATVTISATNLTAEASVAYSYYSQGTITGDNKTQLTLYGSVSWQTSQIQTYAPPNYGNAYAYAVIGPYDLTSVNTITAHMRGSGDSNMNCQLYVAKTNNTTNPAAIKNQNKGSGAWQDVSVDVSSLTGDYYVYVGTGNYNQPESRYCWVDEIHPS